MICKYFLPLLGLSFHSFFFLCCAQAFQFDVVLFIFDFVVCASDVIPPPPKSLPRTTSRSFLPVSSRMFMVLHLMFNPLCAGYKFQDCFFYFCEKHHWNFHRNHIESVIILCNLNILTILILLIHEHRDIFPFIYLLQFISSIFYCLQCIDLLHSWFNLLLSMVCK